MNCLVAIKIIYCCQEAQLWRDNLSLRFLSGLNDKTFHLTWPVVQYDYRVSDKVGLIDSSLVMDKD